MLNNWKSAFLKARVLTLIIIWSIHIPQSCELHPCTITIAQAAFSFDVTGELALVTIRSGITSPQAHLSITWPKKFSLMHSRILLQVMSGWFKSQSWNSPHQVSVMWTRSQLSSSMVASNSHCCPWHIHFCRGISAGLSAMPPFRTSL